MSTSSSHSDNRPGVEEARTNQAFTSFLERLRPAEVADVPAAWRVGTTPDTPYPGDCYYRSFRYVSKHCTSIQPLWLVQGEYWLGARHAWVELPDDLVFDGVMQRFYRKDAYYEIQGARAWYKFESGAAVLVAINLPSKDGLTQYGYWDSILGLPWADPANPTVIDYDRAWELLVSSGLRADLPKQSRRRKKAKST
jgi:hypothetical protein